MTTPSPAGILDFFVLEASEYVDQLDSLLQHASTGSPDADAMQKLARALRGSATMAKLPAFSEVAAGIERVGRAVREGGLPWDVALRGVVISAVDDCKIFLRNVRTWSDADSARAKTRVAELTGYAPPRGGTPLASPTTVGHDAYLANEASNIGAGLELIATRPTDRDSAANVLRRVRALRGIASVKDHPALADVLEAAEDAAHTIETGQPTGLERITLLQSAAAVLRSIAANLRAGAGHAVAPTDLAKFMTAMDAMQDRETGSDRVVPIADLFYQDGAPGVVQAAAHPPTTPAQRFRLEAVNQGEHLRRVISDARDAHDDLGRERVRRSLRSALRALTQSAESYGEGEVAAFVQSRAAAALHLDAPALAALDNVAGVLAQPGTDATTLSERIRALMRARTSGSMPAIALTPVSVRAMPTPAAASPVAPPMPFAQERVAPAASALAAEAPATGTPSEKLGALLDSGIASLGALQMTPLSSPVTIEEQPPVPIGVLLYRGRAAIERCREIRDDVRRAGGVPNADALSELFDLLDLALTG